MDPKELTTDAIDSKPHDIDWREALGEDCEGWRYYEAIECDECGETVVCSFPGEEHRHLDNETECQECLYAEGPMMNYWYPVALDDVEEAARAIVRTNLCVVEFEDGQTGLALTGGGMDFSWEICAAFIALGKLPPAHFCNLPAMAGKHREPGWREVVAACKRSLEIQTDRLQCRKDDLDRLEKDLLEDIAKEAS